VKRQHNKQIDVQKIVETVTWR